VRVDGE